MQTHKIKLIPYYPNYDTTYQWYQDLDVCKQVDNIDFVYDMKRLQDMYKYLDENGDCFYIQYDYTLVGDITLLKDGEISIVISKEYQNKHIGRQSVKEILKLAKNKGFKIVKANIYDFNKQSIKMFESVGFEKIEGELYQKKID